MSAEMRDFAAAFSHGMDRGVGLWEKSQQQAIEHEKNKVLRDQHEAQERHNTFRDNWYAQSVTNAGVLSAARAQAALAKANKGAATGAPAPAGDLNWLKQGAAEHGLAIPEAPATQPVQVNVMGGSGTTETPDPGPVAPPSLAAAKGGMIRKYADGGMTVQEALSYGPKAQKDTAAPATPASAMNSAFSSAYEKSKAAADAKTKTPPPVTQDPRVGPSLKLAQANVPNINSQVQAISPTPPPAPVVPAAPPVPTPNPGDPGYRRGGAVRRFAGGGSADLSDPQAAIKTMAYTPADKNPDGSKKTKEQQDDPIAASGRGSSAASDFSSAFASASANGATGSGGDSTGGASGTGGVGGSASGGQGGSAAAGVGGDDGGTYRRGGRVRRFASGGRVMEAIDTGTSGPGSGYGYRAAPPSRGY